MQNQTSVQKHHQVLTCVCVSFGILAFASHAKNIYKYVASQCTSSPQSHVQNLLLGDVYYEQGISIIQYTILNSTPSECTQLG